MSEGIVGLKAQIREGHLCISAFSHTSRSWKGVELKLEDDEISAEKVVAAINVLARSCKIDGFEEFLEEARVALAQGGALNVRQ